VSATTTREVLYVSATRGRESNRLYVDVAYDPDPATSHDGVTAPATVEEVLTGVLRNEGADLSAHQTRAVEEYRAESIPALAAEYLTLSRDATARRLESVLAQVLNADELAQVLDSEALGPLEAMMRRAEARGLALATLMPELARHTFAGADDVAAVLTGRLHAYMRAIKAPQIPAFNLVCGLFPRPQGVSDPDMAKALDERAEAMEARARMLATEALVKQVPWTQAFGVCPVGPLAEVWLDAVATLAAYRERWDVTSRTPLGGEPKTVEWIGQKKRAEAAMQRAVAVGQQATRGYGIEAPVPVPTLAG